MVAVPPEGGPVVFDVVVVVDGAVVVVVVGGAVVVVVGADDVVVVVGATVVDVLDVEDEDVGVLVVVVALALAAGGSDGLPGGSVTCAPAALAVARGARKERTTAMETNRRAALWRLRSAAWSFPNSRRT